MSSTLGFKKFRQNSLSTLIQIFPREKTDELLKFKHKIVCKMMIYRNYIHEVNEDSFLINQEVDSLVKCLFTMEVEDRNHVISGHESGFVKIWYLSTDDKKNKIFKQRVSFKAHDQEVRGFAQVKINFEQFLVTSSKDNSVKFWSLSDTSKERFKITKHTDMVISILAYETTNGEVLLCTAGLDNIIYVWNVNKLEEPKFKFEAHEDAPCYLTIYEWNNQRFLASGGWDDTILLFNLEGNSPNEPVYKLKGHDDSAACLSSLNYNGKKYLISGSWDYSVKVWDLTRPENCAYNLVSLNEDNQDSIYGIGTTYFNNDQCVVVPCFNKFIYIWNLKNPHEPRFKVGGASTQFHSCVTMMIKREPILVCGSKSHLIAF